MHKPLEAHRQCENIAFSIFALNPKKKSRKSERHCSGIGTHFNIVDWKDDEGLRNQNHLAGISKWHWFWSKNSWHSSHSGVNLIQVGVFNKKKRPHNVLQHVLKVWLLNKQAISSPNNSDSGTKTDFTNASTVCLGSCINCLISTPNPWDLYCEAVQSRQPGIVVFSKLPIRSPSETQDPIQRNS